MVPRGAFAGKGLTFSSRRHAEQIREVAVAKPVQGIGPLAQCREQAGALAEGFRDVLGLRAPASD